MRRTALGILLFLSVSAVAQSGQGSPTRAQAGPESRVQFEYLRISVTNEWNPRTGHSKPVQISVEYPDGRSEAATSLMRALQEAGAQGWELVAVDSDHELGDEGWVNRFYILKRTKR